MSDQVMGREDVQEILYPGDSDDNYLSIDECNALLAHDAALREELAAIKRCSICKTVTDICCADCRIDLATTVYVCKLGSCRDEHEKKCTSNIDKLREELAALQEESSQWEKTSLVEIMKDRDRLRDELTHVEMVLRDYNKWKYEPSPGLAHLACSVRDALADLERVSRERDRLREERDTLLTQLDSLRASDRAYAESQERSCALILEIREELAQVKQERDEALKMVNSELIEHMKFVGWAEKQKIELERVTKARDSAVRSLENELAENERLRKWAEKRIAELEGRP